MTFAIHFQKNVPCKQNPNIRENSIGKDTIENKKLLNQKNAKIPWIWNASEFFLRLLSNNTYETKEMEITSSIIKKNQNRWTYRVTESLVLEKSTDDDKEISNCKRIAKKVLKIFLKIILVMFLPVAILISDSYRKKYNVPKYFPTINNSTMEKIYKSRNLTAIKTDKNIGLTSKQIKNSENVRKWFLKNRKHLKTVQELDLSKNQFESGYTLKKVYLNDFLNLFSKLENLDLSGTQANNLHFGELPKSLKNVNLSNNSLFKPEDKKFPGLLPDINFNFEGASNLTIDFSGNDFALNHTKLSKDFFKDAKNITIQIFNPPHQFGSFEGLKTLMENHFDNKDIKFEIKNKF